MSGLILPHDHFGTHLDNNGRTIDTDLEIKNFEHAGGVLAEVWSSTVVNGHSVTAEFIDVEATSDITRKSEKWRAEHLRSSQYILQIVKCLDEECCGQFNSSYLQIVPDRFLPPPIPVVQKADGLSIVRTGSDSKATYLALHQAASMTHVIPDPIKAKYKTLPYDLFNPAVRNELGKKTCKYCHMLFGTITLLNLHEKNCDDSFIIDSAHIQRKARPLRIAARRTNEILCLMQQQELEWMAIDEVEMGEIELSSIPTQSNSSGTPEISPDESLMDIGDD